MQGWIERLPGCDPFECVSDRETAAGYVLLTIAIRTLSARYHTLLDLTEYYNKVGRKSFTTSGQ